jgi:hypothetical protein
MEKIKITEKIIKEKNKLADEYYNKLFAQQIELLKKKKNIS